MEETLRPSIVEGAVIGQTLSQISWLVTGMYFGVNAIYAEVLTWVGPQLQTLVPALIFLATTGVGLVAEANALKRKGFTVNPVTNAVFSKSEKLILSQGAGFAYGLASNPANLVLVANLAIGKEQGLATMTHLCSVATLGLVYAGINAYISVGKTDQLVRGVHRVNEKAKETVSRMREMFKRNQR